MNTVNCEGIVCFYEDLRTSFNILADIRNRDKSESSSFCSYPVIEMAFLSGKQQNICIQPMFIVMYASLVNKLAQ